MRFTHPAVGFLLLAVVLFSTWWAGYTEGKRVQPAQPDCVVVHSHTEAARVWLDGKRPCEGGR